MRQGALKCCSPFILTLVLASHTNAAIIGSTPAASFDLGATSLSSFGDGTLGWEFTANSGFFVTDLGWLDAGTPGLGTFHEVGIWDENENLVVSTTVQSGTGSAFVDDFRYEPIAPTFLQAGKNYVVAGRVRDNDSQGVSGLDSLPPGFSLEPEISLVGGRTNGGNSSFAYPGSFFIADRVYLGPNFQFTTAAIPEPSTLTLLLVALVGLRLTRRTCK